MILIFKILKIKYSFLSWQLYSLLARSVPAVKPTVEVVKKKIFCLFSFCMGRGVGIGIRYILSTLKFLLDLLDNVSLETHTKAISLSFFIWDARYKVKLEHSDPVLYQRQQP